MASENLFSRSFYVIDLQADTVEKFSYTETVRNVGWTPDGSSVFSIAEDAKVVKWNPITKENSVICDLANSQFPVSGDFAFNSDCSKVAAVLVNIDAGLMSTALHDLKDNKQLFSWTDAYQQFANGMGSLSLSTTDTIALSAWYDLALWDKSAKVTIKVNGPKQNCAAWNNKGTTVAVCNTDDMIKLYSITEKISASNSNNAVAQSQGSMCAVQ